MKIAYQGIPEATVKAVLKKTIPDVRLFPVKHLMNALRWPKMIII